MSPRGSADRSVELPSVAEVIRTAAAAPPLRESLGEHFDRLLGVTSTELSSTQDGYQPKSYDTRIDQFRRRYGIPLQLWAAEADISRSLIARYRAATADPYVETLAKLVRAARRITGRQVRAAELFDLGEDEPVNREPCPRRKATRGGVREFYNTRFDGCLIREGILPAHLARESGISRPTILKKRTGAESFRVSVLAKLVRALRRMGREVQASDLANVGEDG